MLVAYVCVSVECEKVRGGRSRRHEYLLKYLSLLLSSFSPPLLLSFSAIYTRSFPSSSHISSFAYSR